jgi:hypothetical protein
MKSFYMAFLVVAQASCLCVFGRLAHLGIIPGTRNKLRYYQRARGAFSRREKLGVFVSQFFVLNVY